MTSYHEKLAAKIVRRAIGGKGGKEAKSGAGIIRQVTAPNGWKCSDCGSEIRAGTKCWKQGSKKICDNCLYSARESK